ncbi:hypothetical protein J6590_033469 [Homalodisca vitripennis]|nr:hypothetical protein J6590_033469 [Homalodisca vitripennis]
MADVLQRAHVIKPTMYSAPASATRDVDRDGHVPQEERQRPSQSRGRTDCTRNIILRPLSANFLGRQRNPTPPVHQLSK